MDHEQAVKGELAERYAFRELPEPDRDQFEEHLADCSRCLEDVRTAQTLAANARAVFQDEANSTIAQHTVASPVVPWWRRRAAFAFSSGLNLGLAALAIYAFFGIIPLLQTQKQSLEAPAIAESYVIHDATRGAAAQSYSIRQGASAAFRLDVPNPAQTYTCVLEDVSEHSKKTYNLRGTGSTETLTLMIPTAGLAPGEYRVYLQGIGNGASESVAEFMLRVTAGH